MEHGVHQEGQSDTDMPGEQVFDAHAEQYVGASADQQDTRGEVKGAGVGVPTGGTSVKFGEPSHICAQDTTLRRVAGQ